MKATIVDLRYRMKDVIAAIDRGETVVVFHRGKEKAKLTPVSPSSGTSADAIVMTKDQPFFGIWNDREDLADPVAYVRKLRKNRQSFADPRESLRSNKRRKVK